MEQRYNRGDKVRVKRGIDPLFTYYGNTQATPRMVKLEGKEVTISNYGICSSTKSFVYTIREDGGLFHHSMLTPKIELPKILNYKRLM